MHDRHFRGARKGLRIQDMSSLAVSRHFRTRKWRHHLSWTSLALVADLVRRYLPVRTLVRFKVVSKEWRAWCDENLLQIAKERRKDASSRDWYFPIAFDSPSMTSKWYGVHQCTQRQETLPHLAFLPDNDIHYKIEAVSSGLLVLSKFLSPYSFILIVCNPLSKKWRRLPRQSNCKDTRVCRAYQGKKTQTHLVVDDLSNEYKLIRLSSNCVNVYSSATNCWVCSPSENSSPLKRFSGCFNGRVYIMKLISTWRYSVIIYDIESGGYEMIPCITFNDFDCRDFYISYGYSFHENWLRSRTDPVLVECMGNLYAVAASCQGRYHDKVRGSNWDIIFSVKIKFHIFKLTHEGEVMDGLIWNHVELPLEMGCTTYKPNVWVGLRYFGCVARSTMIYLTWLGGFLEMDQPFYSLQYDVVSGTLSKMYRAARGEFFNPGQGCMAYTPSLDLEP